MARCVSSSPPAEWVAATLQRRIPSVDWSWREPVGDDLALYDRVSSH